MNNNQTLLFINDIEELVGKNRQTLRRWWEKDKFPKPIKPAGTMLAWHKTEIDDWLNQQTKKV